MALARPSGVERIRRPKGMEPDAKVNDGTIEFEVPESWYRQNGYEPEFDKLPWREESERPAKG